MSTYSQISLMDTMSSSGEVYLEHDMLMIILITIMVSVISYASLVMKNRGVVEEVSSSELESFSEIMWTVLPLFILSSMSLPSLVLLFKLEYASKVDLSCKVVSHQWYWSYSGDSGLSESWEFDSYMIPGTDLFSGDFRLLEVDNSLVLPYSLDIRISVTSEDVLHSWAVPSFYMKADAVPSRLNSLFMRSNMPSVVYSQCSEICSVNHSFMPICIEFVDWKKFLYHVAAL